VEYSSLESAALGRALKFAIILPPSIHKTQNVSIRFSTFCTG
jgi:hypothetical protein